MLDQRGFVLPGARAAKAADPSRPVRLWLFGVAFLIFMMVIVGGLTRLTELGLSITQWQPITGVMLPQSEADWQAEFARYKQIPQYAALNRDMTLFGFKTIYEWEWSHRLLARLIGAAFVFPALWFWWQGLLVGALRRQVLIAAGLLALEPIVGWWMVSSGLADRIEVAQDRLALHLADRRRDLLRADLRRGRARPAPARGGRARGSPGRRRFSLA